MEFIGFEAMQKKKKTQSAVDLRLIQGKLLSCQDHSAYNILVLGITR